MSAPRPDCQQASAKLDYATIETRLLRLADRADQIAALLSVSMRILERLWMEKEKEHVDLASAEVCATLSVASELVREISSQSDAMCVLAPRDEGTQS